VSRSGSDMLSVCEEGGALLPISLDSGSGLTHIGRLISRGSTSGMEGLVLAPGGLVSGLADSAGVEDSMSTLAAL
jgi:hypothetical protein